MDKYINIGGLKVGSIYMDHDLGKSMFNFIIDETVDNPLDINKNERYYQKQFDITASMAEFLFLEFGPIY